MKDGEEGAVGDATKVGRDIAAAVVARGKSIMEVEVYCHFGL